MATQNNASGDKFISYPTAGHHRRARDDPRQPSQQLFAERDQSTRAPNPARPDA
jgi:hypothetical protein